MSDKLFPIPIHRLYKMIVEEEEKHRTIFGLSKEQFFIPSSIDPYKVRIDGNVQETPIGVAPGPHTQMSQNIISAWLTGARYIELKTVQYNDSIEVTKPCIDMEDEGYNCEWSQELRIEDSFNEYLNAWILIHLLRNRFKWNKNNENGFIFNVSIGYDLQSILSKKIQWFLDKADNCADDIEKKREKLLKSYPEVKEIEIPERMSNSVTLSLMHGSPPEEIERIGRYLIEERKFNTSIKLNPTLLGMSRLKEILNEKLGYRVIVPNAAFEHDLKYDDALRIIDSLKSISKKNNVSFRIKLTNTLETINLRKTLPEKEKIIYMSGRALHPIAVNLAAKLQSDFKGELDISFAGGVDYLNVCDVIACGMAPVTVCTDILKPGGYYRLLQYLEKIEIELEKFEASNIYEYIKSKAGNKKDNLDTAALKNLKAYAEKSIEQKYYKKEFFPDKNIKGNKKLTYFDCISAPCVEKCATDQNIPEYLYLTSIRDYNEAFQTILKTNAFPSVTALICDHLCQQRCTRINYDNPIMIKDVKRFISEKSRFKELKNRVNKKIGIKVAIIGAGPSGFSCAYFLIREGFQVEVFEARSFAGGMLSYVIPKFRLPAEKIARDIKRIEWLGVKIHYNTKIDKQLFEKLKREYDFIYISSGAQKSKRLLIEGEESNKVTDALTFLSQIRIGETISHGKDIAIVGGGNSAIDAARTALRINKSRGNVTIIYRRTRNEMPADKDEIAAAFNEGVGLLELTALSKIEEVDGRIKLKCYKMKLGEEDETLRPKPLKIEGSEFELVFDFLIYAIGQNADIDFFKENNKESKNIFIGGDAFRGSSTLINAVGDGKKCAEKIIKKVKKKKILKNVNIEKELNHSDLIKMRSKRSYGIGADEGAKKENRLLLEDEAVTEASRCLFCDELCDICVTVCPNRANISYKVEPVYFKLQKVVIKNGKEKIKNDKVFELEQKYQVLNIADLCNECGNCRTFCPRAGAPYIDKPRLCLTEKSFENEEKAFIIGFKNGKRFIKFKDKNNIEMLLDKGEFFLYSTPLLKSKLNKEDLSIKQIKLISSKVSEINFKNAALLSVLLRSVPEIFYKYK